MSLELIGKFIGPDEIVSSELSDFKTPSGKDVVQVVFKNGRKRIFTVETLEYIVTDTESDYTTVQQKHLTPVIRKVLNVLAEHDIKNGDVEMFFKMLATNIDLAFGRAINFMWFKDDKEFTPGFDPQYDVSLLMAHRVITTMPDRVEEKKEDGSTT